MNPSLVFIAVAIGVKVVGRNAKSEDTDPILQKTINEAYTVKDITSTDDWDDTAEYQLLLLMDQWDIRKWQKTKKSSM